MDLNTPSHLSQPDPFHPSHQISVNREKQIYKVTIVGSVVNLFLVGFKLIAGFLGHSSAMIADAVHSISDLVTDVVVLLFVRIAGRPEDNDHAYGHGKYETLAGVIVGVLLGIVGLGLLADGVMNTIAFYKGASIEAPNWWALSAAIISILLKESLFRYTIHYGEKLDSPALKANGWHHRSDAFTSVAALVGIAGAMLLGPSWRVLDPLAAAVVSLFIISSSWGLVKSGIQELLEKSLPDDELSTITDIISSVQGVDSFHKLRTRRIGTGRAIEMHLKMNPDISLRKAHDIASDVEKRLQDHFGQQTHVGIHMEPTE